MRERLRPSRTHLTTGQTLSSGKTIGCRASTIDIRSQQYGHAETTDRLQPAERHWLLKILSRTRRFGELASLESRDGGSFQVAGNQPRRAADDDIQLVRRGGRVPARLHPVPAAPLAQDGF